ncbi:hypothetical protein CBR_g18662 [Chara braunii]|uniref:Reverse transcriptase domain-containing protein n=1 Tax=Chara braunii TaxID=69332 RepID=A0A388JTF4_CHABU|nr:hypothetical protein CBR_g18662 [Chara braunii]|eukprot:GBG61070.1 hypothetical protein CBR_g18662 [Chara braunii]
MDKLMTFEQGTLPRVDWIAEYQRLTSIPDIQMGFKAVKHYFISRSCPALGNALTPVEDPDDNGGTLRQGRTHHCHEQGGQEPPPFVCSRPEQRSASAQSGRGRGGNAKRPNYALLDSGASRNFMSQAFMQRAGLGTQVRRKANPTAIKLADGRTQQLIDCYIEAVPVYFAPHACEPVTFDILDTDFNIILGMPWLASADHMVNFHRQTLTVRDAFGAEVPCTIPLPHPSIRCHVVTAKSFRATCAYEQPDEIGLCFLRTVAVADSSPTDLSLDPRVVRLLDGFTDIFESPTGVVPDRRISHEIILEAGVVPPTGCIYRMSEEDLTVLRTQLDNLLDKGWIGPSSSPYGAPILFVRKKNKGLRLCIEYRKLNAQTVKNAGPLPRIDDLLERLGDAKYFSKLDLKSGCHQISIRPNDRYKSTFKTRYGHFEWVVMPFGLTNAPTTFQAAMTNEFRAMLDRFMLVYLDDILVYSRSFEDHLEHLRRVLETLRRAKYKANRNKCEFVRQELEYLGHFVTPEGISPLADKIQAIQEWPEPWNVTDVRSFLGLAGYYQRFIKGYSKIAAHLTKLQCEDRPFDFGEDARESFLALKAALLSAEVLRIYDPLLPTLVTTDASSYGIGAVLEQHDGVDWHSVKHFSKKVPVVHSMDDAHKKEPLAFVHALKRWRHFLLGRSQFRWVTDNNPFVFYKTQDTDRSTIARWRTFIDQFDFFPEHIPRKSNRFADALSRRTDHCTAVYSTFEIGDDLQDSFIRSYQADREFRDKQKQQQDTAALAAAVRAAVTQQQQQHQLLKSALARINSIEAKASAAPGCTTDTAKQFNERIDHVVNLIGDLSDFTSPATISSTVAAIKTDITKLQSQPAAAAKVYKMPRFNIGKFEDCNKTDALTWWQAFLTKASCHKVPDEDMIKALYLQLIGGAQAWMNHLAVNKGTTIAELHKHLTWEDFEQMWFTRFMVRNVVKAAMNEVHTCSQGNMPTRDWTIKRQKIVTTPGFDLSFTNQRAEFFSRSCAGLRTALGNEYDYASFQAILDRANLVIQTDDKAANERQSQPHYVAKQGYQRPAHNNAVISEEIVDLHAAAAYSGDGGTVAALPPKRPKRVRKNKATQATTSTGTGQQPWTAFNITKEVFDLRQHVLIYLDDILVYSRTLDEHIVHLRAVLDRLQLAKYKANLDKCEFAKQELEYLGHFVTPKGIRPLADKIQAIVDWPETRCTTYVRSSMGLAGYYQRFVESYSKVAAPLSRLQSPKVPFEFDDAASGTFTTLKAAMQAALALRIYDPTLPTQVTTDASGYGIGAVLEQCHEDGWHPVEYFSQKVPLVNTLDNARKKELLAFVTVLKWWRHFLLGRRRFKWNTDNID